MPLLRMWVHCPRASNGPLPRRSNLVGYVRWDAQSDRFPPCQTIIPTAFRSQSGLPTDGSAYEVVVLLKTAGDFAYMNGTSSCSYRMVRGGDWGDPPTMIRSAARNWAPPPETTLRDYRSGGVGFRVARTLDT